VREHIQRHTLAPIIKGAPDHASLSPLHFDRSSLEVVETARGRAWQLKLERGPGPTGGEVNMLQSHPPCLACLQTRGSTLLLQMRMQMSFCLSRLCP